MSLPEPIFGWPLVINQGGTDLVNSVTGTVSYSINFTVKPTIAHSNPYIRLTSVTESNYNINNTYSGQTTLQWLAFGK